MKAEVCGGPAKGQNFASAPDGEGYDLACNYGCVNANAWKVEDLFSAYAALGVAGQPHSVPARLPFRRWYALQQDYLCAALAKLAPYRSIPYELPIPVQRCFCLCGSSAPRRRALLLPVQIIDLFPVRQRCYRSRDCPCRRDQTAHFSSSRLCIASRLCRSSSSAARAAFFASAFLAFLR